MKRQKKVIPGQLRELPAGTGIGGIPPRKTYIGHHCHRCNTLIENEHLVQCIEVYFQPCGHLCIVECYRLPTQAAKAGGQ